MNERQYLLHHLLYLSEKLSEAETDNERQNVEQALLFYAKELKKAEQRCHKTYLQ